MDKMIWMNLSAIHFHDCRLKRVTEITASDDYLFEVEYPIDWEQNQFAPRTIVFRNVLEYSVHEGAFQGPPTLLDVLVGEQVGRHYRLRIETNAGYRTLLCSNVELLAPTA